MATETVQSLLASKIDKHVWQDTSDDENEIATVVDPLDMNKFSSKGISKGTGKLWYTREDPNLQLRRTSNMLLREFMMERKNREKMGGIITERTLRQISSKIDMKS